MRDGMPSPKESKTSVPQNMGIITSDIWYIMQCHWKKLHKLSRNCQNIRYHVWKSGAPYPRSAYRVVGPHLSTESPRGFAPSVVNFCLSFPRWRNGERDNFCENTSKRFERGISFYINSPGRQGWMCAQPTFDPDPVCDMEKLLQMWAIRPWKAPVVNAIFRANAEKIV